MVGQSAIYRAGRIGEDGSMPAPFTAYAAVAADPPRVPEGRIARAVGRQFGLNGDWSPLVSERDQNLLLRAVKGAQYVVKVTALTEPPLVSEFQAEALLWVEKIAGLAVPQVVRTLDGQLAGRLDHAGESYRLRLVSYVCGDLLSSVVVDPGLAGDFGVRLATLDAALAGFSHPGERPVLLWDLQRAAELRDLFDYIDDPSAREHVGAAIDDFEARVVPHLDTVRSQVIHGDPNPENVLVDTAARRVSGIIDFGDMVRAPRVFDVAIAAAYLRSSGEELLELIVPFVAGYHGMNPLSESEQAMLFDLVRARLATTVTLLFWRLAVRGGDDPYRQKTFEQEAGALGFLRALDRLGGTAFQRRLQREI